MATLKRSNYLKISTKLTKTNKNKLQLFKTKLTNEEIIDLYKIYYMHESFQDLIKKIGSYLNLNNQDVILGKIYFLCQEFMLLNHFYDSKMSKEDILENLEFLKLKDFLRDYLIAVENLTSVIHKLSNLFLESRELLYFKLT